MECIHNKIRSINPHPSIVSQSVITPHCTMHSTRVRNANGAKENIAAAVKGR